VRDRASAHFWRSVESIADSWKRRFDFISSSKRISFFESTRTPTISLSSMQPR